MSTGHMIEPVPEEIESPEAKLVYLYLEAADSATVDDVNEALTMKKIAALSVLGSLSSRGLVYKDGEHYAVAS